LTCCVLVTAWALACSPSRSSDLAVAPQVDSGGDAVIDAAVPMDAQAATDAQAADAYAAADAADAAPVVLKQIGGHVEAGGAVVGAKVSVLSPPMMTTTDASGNFTFNLPLGAAVVIKVEALDPARLPMIRGLVVGPTNRPRFFFLTGPQELGALQSLGFTPDPAKALVEVDFRNSTHGGYSVTLTGGGTTLTPSFGAALDGTGVPRATMVTLAGGTASTLYLGNVAPSDVAFTPDIGDAGLPCKPCDGPALPTQAGVVTWYDFECGSATDCL
jgi:hypothetical protein